jgi:outer membrane protein assembly factor BamB
MRNTLAVIIVLSCLSCSQEKLYETPVNDQHTSVLTQHNNNFRSGLNNHEIILNTSNVNTKQFGKLFTLPVDDQVFAQPLVVFNVPVAGNKHTVVYVATVNNTVYAFDGENGQLYWKRNFTEPGMRPPKNTDMTGACSGNYQDFTGNIGIVGDTCDRFYFSYHVFCGKKHSQQ